MTAITVPATRPAAAGKRQVPWSRLAWVTWRQHRGALAGVTALLGAIGVYLLVMGLEIHSAYDKLAACHPAGSAACQSLQQSLESFYGSQSGSVMSSGINAQTVPFLLLAVPVLIGAFVGAPVLARELETGTFRFAWTQGCGRLRWAVTKLVVIAVALTAVAYLFSLLFGWYISPFTVTKTGEFPMQLFGNLGVAFAAWTLLAYAMAVFAGVVIRRTVAAMATTMIVWTVLDVATMMAIRQHYMTPVTTSGNSPANNDWLLSGWITNASGQRVRGGSASLQLPASVQQSHGQGAYLAWLHSQHLTQWWSYQPASRFWDFQLIEGGWLLALSAILLGASVYLVRRRAA